MATNILPFQKKLRLVILSIIFAGTLIYLSQSFFLNERAQRFLVKTLNVPQQFFTQIITEYREFENEKIALLEEEILNLQDEIYEKDLEIQSLESSKSFNNFNTKLPNTSETFISSFDQMNFTCCNKHRVYSTNPKEYKKGTYSVSQGNFVVGKTRNISNDEIEIRLLSDPEEFISIKTINGFYCIAKGSSIGRIINCTNESKAVSYEIGDTFFTTGFDGIYPEGMIVGRLTNIQDLGSNIFQETLEIQLFFDPYQSINKRVIFHE